MDLSGLEKQAHMILSRLSVSFFDNPGLSLKGEKFIVKWFSIKLFLSNNTSCLIGVSFLGFLAITFRTACRMRALLSGGILHSNSVTMAATNSNILECVCGLACSAKNSLASYSKIDEMASYSSYFAINVSKNCRLLTF